MYSLKILQQKPRPYQIRAPQRKEENTQYLQNKNVKRKKRKAGTQLHSGKEFCVMIYEAELD